MIEVQSLSGTEESNVSVHDSLIAVDPLQKMDVFFFEKEVHGMFPGMSECSQYRIVYC